MYQVLVNIEKISEMFMKKINLLKNVTVKLKKKFHQIITVLSLNVVFFLILTLENVECVSWYMITQKWKKNQCTCTISVFIQFIFSL